MKVCGQYNKKKGNEDKLKKSNEGVMVKKKEVHIKLEEEGRRVRKGRKAIRGIERGEGRRRQGS